jgi:glucose/arabinose dehydrogenase
MKRYTRTTRSWSLAAAALLLAGPALAQTLPPERGTLTPDTARERKMLGELKAPEGFRLTLFAGPPVAEYPTCLTPAADGAIFACVDPNLSLSRERGIGRVVRLVDEDGDGHADRYTTFAKMDSPRGIVYDGKTLYVMHPPVLTAYRDTDGDGVADESEDLVTGLGFDLDFRGADHTTNQIAMGIDGWIYIAVGDYGYRKAVGRDGTQISHRGGSVVRVRPDGTGLEIYATGTRNIYDVAIDPFLHVFSRDNTNDGDGWNTRFHYLAPGANMGYPVLYQNFADELFPSLADYGSGSGTGGLFVQDPGLPEGYDNTLYTADWTMNQIYRHPLKPKGASFEAGQEPFLSVVHPSDLVVDGRSNLYVASLSGGTFTFSGDTVGYIARVTYPGRPGSEAFLPAKATDAALLEALVSPVGVHRLDAQQELLRRGPKAATVARLREYVLDREQPDYARVAAMFTLKQLVGAEANSTLGQAAVDPDATVRALALRALADRQDQLAGVPVALFTRALSDPDAKVRVQAINGLVRMGARDEAVAIVPLTGDSDPALAHLAVNALVSLDASRAALGALDGASPAVRTGALRGLERMHEPWVARSLVERYRRESDAAARRDLFLALARLYNEEGTWLGDWWTTKPSFIGPYFDPQAWEGSAMIRPVLREALRQADGAEFGELVDGLVLNRVLPQGSKPLLTALAAGQGERRAAAVDALLGHSDLSGVPAPLLAELDAASPELHAAVARLVAAQADVGDDLLPLVRSAALDAKLDAEVRGELLRAAGALPVEKAAPLFAQLNPEPADESEVARAWRRFVGNRDRFGQGEYFVSLTKGDDPAQQILGYAVLLQAARNSRIPAEVKAPAVAAIDAGWADAARAPRLARAVTIMHLESQYADQLRAQGLGGK